MRIRQLFGLLLIPFIMGACSQPPSVATLNQKAPDFEAPNQDGDAVKLSDFRGQNVVLAFTRAHW